MQYIYLLGIPEQWERVQMPYILPKYPTHIFISRTSPRKHCTSLNFFIKYIPQIYCVLHILFKNVDGIGSFALLLGKKLEDGKCIGGARRLTMVRIDTMQSFYGLSIRQNKGSSSAMSKATQAILLHFPAQRTNPNTNVAQLVQIHGAASKET